MSQSGQMRDSVLLLYTGMGAFIEEYPRRCYKWSGTRLVTKWGAGLGQALSKASDKCPDGKCPDAGHLAAWALLVLMHINELWQSMGHSPTKDIISVATAQMCFFFVTKY